MNFVKYHVSRNLFDVSTQTVGYFVRAGNTGPSKPLGNIEQNAAYNLSAYIAVIPNTIYTIKYPVGSLVGGAGLVYYSDNSGTTISGISLGDQGQTYTFTTPNDCNYIRFSYDNSAGTDVMLNSGSQPLPYEPYGNTWTDSHYIMGTSTDTITTLPADIYANGTTATVGLKGQMEQSGTPSPTTPIQPSECGERTGNLFDEEYPSISSTAVYKPVYVDSGEFTLSSTIQKENDVALLFFLAGNVSTGIATSTNGVWEGQNRTVTAVDGYVTIAYRKYNTSPENSNTMLNTGSTALPYEPYGYKIPISSANTTTPVYLGEVETIRKIKKLVLTGNEDWALSTSYNGGFYLATINPDYMRAENSNLAISTHYITDNQTASIGNITQGHMSFSYTSAQRLYIRDTNYATVDAFKTYLQQQYTNGTPVTVWYVLATETTGIVNEPLMKIGDYADEVSNVSIPVTAGGDTLSVGTTVQPSEVTVNYKGWHAVQSVHERESGAWT